MNDIKIMELSYIQTNTEKRVIKISDFGLKNVILVHRIKTTIPSIKYHRRRIRC